MWKYWSRKITKNRIEQGGKWADDQRYENYEEYDRKDKNSRVSRNKNNENETSIHAKPNAVIHTPY